MGGSSVPELINDRYQVGEVIGRGEVRFDSEELHAIKGKKMEELPEEQRRSVVHADYLSNFASRI